MSTLIANLFFMHLQRPHSVGLRPIQIIIGFIGAKIFKTLLDATNKFSTCHQDSKIALFKYFKSLVSRKQVINFWTKKNVDEIVVGKKGHMFPQSLDILLALDAHN